jgi:carbonic anhydrase/acetyltransferase-like protein (isoleucine patch superfamily)
VHFSAILLGGKCPSVPIPSHAINAGSNTPRFDMDWDAGLSLNPTLQPSLACVELFGQSILERTVARFKQSGLRTISVIAASDCISLHEMRDIRIAVPRRGEDRWSIVKRALLKDLQSGIDTVLIADLGAYVELDLAAALQFHRAKAQAVTPIHDAQGCLAYWIVDAARVLANPEFSFPPEDNGIVDAPQPYQVEGYVNRLADAADFRQLVVDAFLGRCSIRPAGREIKPGVWIEDGARVHKTARLVAPTYVGSNTRVQARAVITRFSNLERNCNVGEGSLVFDASLLPHTLIGRGLDVSSAVVDRTEFTDLSRNVTLRIQDPSLISDVPPQKQYVPAYLPEYEEADRTASESGLEYFDYLSRAKGRLLEVFKGGV